MKSESGPAISGSSRRRGVVTDFDFTAPPRMSREHGRLLDIAFETFARQWATQLGSRLRCSTGISLVGVRQEPYDLFAAGLNAPTVMVVFSPDGKSAGNAMVQLSPELALNHLDFALGGAGGKQPRRELTDIEQSITQGMIERALGTLNYAFASLTTLQPRVDGIVQDPQLLQVAKATDMMLVATFELQVGELTDNVHVMLPLAPISKALNELSQREVRTLEELARAKESTRLLAESLAEVPIDLSFALSPMPSAPSTVLHLAVGDLLRFNHPTADPVLVQAGGTNVGRAVVTTRGNRRACLIVEPEEDQ